MSEPENRMGDSAEVSALRQECANLNRQGNITMAALLLVNLTLAAFLFIQARRDGKDLDEVRPRYMQIVDANKKEIPVLETFVNRLVEHSKTHPELANILAKYPISTAPPPKK